MPSTSTVDLILTEIKDRLSEQLHNVDMIDAKAGIVIAATGVVAAALLTTNRIPSSTICAGQWWHLCALLLLLIMSLSGAIRSYWAQLWHRPPDPRNLYLKYSTTDTQTIKKQLISNYVRAFELNEVAKAKKIRWLTASLVCFGLATTWGLVCILFSWI